MNEEKSFIFLDFNGKLANDAFEKNVFIRIANLHKKNPLIQINDSVFKGSHDYAVGTNLFFESQEETPKQNDVFIKRGPIQFENIFNTMKIIDLKPVQVPPRKLHVSTDMRKLEFNLDWDYKTLLEKFSDGSLQVQDILKNEQTEKEETIEPELEEKMDVQVNDTSKENQKQTHVSVEFLDNEEDGIDDIKYISMLEDYQKLRQLAFRPVKTALKEEGVRECDLELKDAFEYHNLECQILQPCDFFRTEPYTEINEETLSNCVDIDRCILYGVLEKSTTKPRILTNEEKRKVLSLNNFDNLSLAGRYYVLNNHVNDLEEYHRSRSKDELNVRDKFGRTPKQTLEIYKKLTDAVKKRIEEIKFSNRDDCESDSFKLD